MGSNHFRMCPGLCTRLLFRGLIRSPVGWSQVKALRRNEDRELSDERVLGPGRFIEPLTEKVDLVKKYRLTASERSRKAIELISEYGLTFAETAPK